MAYENLCMFCFSNNGGKDVCPNCRRDAREAVDPMHLKPKTRVYNGRFLIGRAIGQDEGGIVYNALDTNRGNVIRIREYMPRDSARRLDDGSLVPETGLEDRFERGLKRLKASVDNVQDPSQRHFYFEENGTGYIAERRHAGDDSGEESSGRRSSKTLIVIIIAAALVIGVAAGVIALVSYFTKNADTKVNETATGSVDVWSPPESEAPTPKASASFAPVTAVTNSWMDFTDPSANPTVAPDTEKAAELLGGLDVNSNIGTYSSPEIITRLQQLLAHLGWMDESEITGVYDAATKQAVRNFQTRVNEVYGAGTLYVDGAAGPNTLKYMSDFDVAFKPAPTPEAITPKPENANDMIDENSAAEEINYLQTRLAALGLLSDSYPNGSYDTVTRNAVMRFQKRVNELHGFNALRNDGTADAATLAYLDYYISWWEKHAPTPSPTPRATATPEPSPTAENSVIDRNSSGATVEYVQEMLTALEYYSGDIDGVYSDEVVQAVKSFQQFVISKHEVDIEPTGDCDLVTLNYLEYYYTLLTEDEPDDKAPVISVSGHLDYYDTIYVVGDGGIQITWSSGTTTAFSVTLTGEDGNVIDREPSTHYTTMNLPRETIAGKGICLFSVCALDEGGSETAAATSSIRLTEQAAGATASPGNPLTVNVSGAESYTDGIYYLAEKSLISWSADGITNYSYYVTDENSEVVYSERNTDAKQFEFDPASYDKEVKYRFTAVAIPEGKSEQQGIYCSVTLVCRAYSATPEPADDVTKPVISVSGALGLVDGIYWAGDEPIRVSWSAFGHVSGYSYYLRNSSGTPLLSAKGTSVTEIEVNPQSMKRNEPYTFTVIAIPENGSEENGLSSAVTLQLYTGQTATPSPAPVGNVDAPEITVNGHKELRDNVYYAGADALTFSWSAKGDISGYEVEITASDGTVFLESYSTTKTNTIVSSEDMEKDVMYTLTVTAVPVNGQASDGSASSARFALWTPPQVAEPEITVNTYERIDGDVYYIGGSSFITWTAENAEKYSVYLTAPDGDVAYKMNDVVTANVTITESMLTYGDEYTLSVIAMRGTDEEINGKRASVTLALANEPPAELTAPVFDVSGYEEFDGETYYLGNDPLMIKWSCPGAEDYDVYLVKPNGKNLRSAEGTAVTSMRLDGEDMTEGKVYTLKVVANAGRSSSSASIKVSKNELREVTFELSVSGYDSSDGNTYFAGGGQFRISYYCDATETYDVKMVYDDDVDNPLKSAEGVRDTEVVVKTSSLEANVPYYLTVRAVDADIEKTVTLIRTEEEEEEPETLEVSVSDYTDIINGVFLVGDSRLNVSWTAKKGVGYTITLRDSYGAEIKSAEAKSNFAYILKSWLDKDSVYTLEISPDDGTYPAEISVMRDDGDGGNTDGFGDISITPDSDSELILRMQTLLYQQGWLSKRAQKGVFDDYTMEAVYDYQYYIIVNDLNPELELIDFEDPRVDSVTLSMLADTQNPILNPDAD